MFDLVGRERVVVGSAAYTGDDFREMPWAVEDGRVDITPLTRRQIAFEHVGDALEELASGTEVAVKVTLAAD
jgi:threonine dehydrogenase-like Zn-dependent dehydrogenase